MAASLRRLERLSQQLTAQLTAGGSFAWSDPGATPSIITVNDPAAVAEWPALAAIGLQHRTFHSAGFGCDVAYCVYLPPGYSEASAPLPVIYNLHGAGGDEFHSFDDVQCLHEGIVEGRWAPMLMVLPNGGKGTFCKDSHDAP